MHTTFLMRRSTTEISTSIPKAYLNSDMAANGYNLTVIGDTLMAPLSLYSNKVNSLDALKELAGLKEK